MQQTKPLHQPKVLIIRPSQQAQNLCEKITALGGQPILFPTIAIEDITDQKNLLLQTQQLNKYDIAIFISPNAVEKALPLIQHPWPRQIKIAAIGSSTAQALHDHNLPVTICPPKQFNTEGLLALPELQTLQGKKILLFRGEGGRELLATTLRQRGAEVTEAIVYRRILPNSDLQALLPRIPDILICTSQTSLENLIHLVGKTDRQWLLNMALLVSSQRLAGLAQTLGFIKPALIADNASDDALIKMLTIWREKQDGAATATSTF